MTMAPSRREPLRDSRLLLVTDHIEPNHLVNIQTPREIELWEQETPCASIDARIRDWDVLPGFGLPLLATTYNPAESNRGGGFTQLPMKKLAFALFVACLSFPVVASAQTSQTAKTAQPIQTIAVSQLRAGMRGVAYTVFEGVKPETMEVEVLGVLHNVNGPKGDMILVRLHGQKVEYTGVVAGMSGSPVYIDGKLAGALAFRIGEFSKEPIAGVTPIADMLEINALDRSPAEEATAAKPALNNAAGKMVGPGNSSAIPPSSPQDFVNYMKPIEAPLVFNGFSEEAVRLFAPQFASEGIVPVMGAGSVSEDVKQPEPLVPGSAVSAVLVRGDMSIEATCTVTYIDPQRLLACGHPLLQFGSVDAQRVQDRRHYGTCRNVRAGSPHRNHGRVRQATGNDSGLA